MHKHMQKAYLCNPKRGLGAPPAWRTADDGTGHGMAALKPRHRGAAAGGWLGRNPISMATHWPTCQHTCRMHANTYIQHIHAEIPICSTFRGEGGVEFINPTLRQVAYPELSHRRMQYVIPVYATISLWWLWSTCPSHLANMNRYCWSGLQKAAQRHNTPLRSCAILFYAALHDAPSLQTAATGLK